MKCVICKHGETKPGMIVVTLVRNSTTLVYKDVPAEVCENCGEEYIDETVSSTLAATADNAIRSGVEVDVRQYIAA
ncbi:MAG: type II toxin-antitoxin system MqsA family antitoxin [bacterium]